MRSSAIAVVEGRREQKLHQITDDQKAAVYKSVAGLLFDVIVRPCKDTTVIFHHPEPGITDKACLTLRGYHR
ncbi:phenylpyruvate tautomerase PptA (4-oxalocrotonate tautomerase family) [Rhizobium sp. OAE497]